MYMQCIYMYMYVHMDSYMYIVKVICNACIVQLVCTWDMCIYIQCIISLKIILLCDTSLMYNYMICVCVCVCVCIRRKKEKSGCI